MKKSTKNFARVFLYTFIIATLLLFGYTASFAITGNEIAQIISNSMEIRKYKVTADDATIDVKYAIEIPEFLISQYMTSQGQVIVDGNPYNIQISVGGENISLGSTLTRSSDGRNVYYQYINTGLVNEEDLVNAKVVLNPPAGANYTEKVETNVQGGINIGSNIKEIVVLEEDHTSLLEAFWGVVTLDIEKVSNYVTELFCGLLIPAGDAFLHMISLAIGEPVTIDKIVYNKVGKIDVDFFNLSANTNNNTSLKNILAGVVNSWYDIFRGITIAVLMIILVYMGIKILLLSTAEKNAAYKGVLVSWVTAVAILMFFPFVMRYIITLNNAFCEWLGAEASRFYSTGAKDGVDVIDMTNTSIDSLYFTYGKDEFVQAMIGASGISASNFNQSAIEQNMFGSNVMMRLRYIAAKKLDVPLAIIYLILIGQLIALLVLYYKRVFMIAFLITIFPLVVAFYPLKKIGVIKFDSFGVWFKEYIVNVLVQTFHAITYTVVVIVGVNSYMQNDNWLFMMMCILFLFEGEKIIRAIFSIKSGANTLGDLAMSGAVAYGAMKSMSKLAPKVSAGSKDSSSITEQGKASSDRIKAGPPKQVALAQFDNGGSSSQRASGSGYGASGRGSSGASGGSAGGAGSAGVDVEIDQTNITPEVESPEQLYKNITKRIEKRIESKKNGIGKAVSGVASNVSGAVGATLGVTYGMATGGSKSGADKALTLGIAGADAGKSFAESASSAVGSITGKATAITAANAVADEYTSGKYDAEIGVTEAMAEADKARAEAMRKIYAEAARRQGKSGKAKAEVKFIKDVLDTKD